MSTELATIKSNRGADGDQCVALRDGSSQPSSRASGGKPETMINLESQQSQPKVRKMG
jgi:hypothetical protein